MSSRKPIRGHSQFKDTILLNQDTYFDYLDRFKKIALSIFDWKNLPDSMDSRFLELSLYYLGKAALLRDKNIFMDLKAAWNGNVNMYGLPTKINCWSYNLNISKKTFMGGLDTISDSNRDEYAVLVMNNFDMIPTAPTLELFAKRLAECQRACDSNVKQQKYPYVVLTTKAQELTFRNLANQIDDGELFIYGDKDGLNLDQIRTIKTDAPYVADKLTEYKKEIWNEALTFLGISNIDYKRERMISSETDSKNELINLNLQSYLIPRKKACDQFNQLFGLTGDKAIDVVVRSDLHNIVKELENSFDEIDGREQMAEKIEDEKGVENE